MPSAAEIELTFETDPGFALPDLTGLPGVAAAAPAEERLLEATYFDTADLRLAAHRLTLRRRTGGHDAGWHLKRPRPDGYRDELQAPLGSVDDPPTELTRLVRVHARGQALVPAVRISTRRIATVLLDAAGEPLVEIAQDDVTTAVLAGGDEPREQSWHELEAELVGGGMDLFEAVREGLLAAGARLSAYPSKLARALGDRVRVPAAPDLEAGTAGEALLETLRQEVAGLITQDPLVRADAPDAVHQMRVGCRRLRALLAAYRGVLDADAVAPLRDELRWLGEELGRPATLRWWVSACGRSPRPSRRSWSSGRWSVGSPRRTRAGIAGLTIASSTSSTATGTSPCSTPSTGWSGHHPSARPPACPPGRSTRTSCVAPTVASAAPSAPPGRPATAATAGTATSCCTRCARPRSGPGTRPRPQRGCWAVGPAATGRR